MLESQYRATTAYFQRLRQHICDAANTANMGKQHRKRLVLSFLSSHRLALPPAVLYRNLRLRENATFSQNSMETYLSELEADGLVKRVDPEALETRDVEQIEEGRGYYLITEAGVAEAPDDSLLA
jgi:DNA-binding PadR family transcriptional regulator